MDILPETSMSTPKSTPLEEFALFPLLPTELRLKIYDLILPNPPINTPRRILNISFSPSLSRYISTTPPPTLLHLSHEARIYTQDQYKDLLLGPNPNFAPLTRYNIPFSPTTDTLYLSSLTPLLSTHLQDILFHLSTSTSRHLIQSLAIDLRCWSELCENGFLSILARMKGLKEVLLVVEFGRSFRGELGWLDVPGWRGDLEWVADRAEGRLREERDRVRIGGRNKGEEMNVRCVILTRGGEQA